MFPSSTKREIRHFHVVVVQRRLRNVQKSVMHVQSCCFANINLLRYCRSHCRRRRRCLSSLPVRKCVQFYNLCSAWLNHLPRAQHVLGGATHNLSTVSNRTYFWGKKRKIIVKQTHLLLCMKGLTLVAVFANPELWCFSLLQVCVPASVMQFTREISRKCNHCHLKELRLIIVRFSHCRKNFTEFKVGWDVIRTWASCSDVHPRYVI